VKLRYEKKEDRSTRTPPHSNFGFLLGVGALEEEWCEAAVMADDQVNW